MVENIAIPLHTVLHTLADISDMRDFITGSHGQRVALLSEAIADQMKCEENEVQKVYYAGLVHDIGKFAVPESILQKHGRLTDDEYEIIKRHAYFTGHILESLIKDSEWTDIIKYASMHHERLDGSGYPDGLKGDSIPLPARIVQVADMFDVMAAKRYYAPRHNMRYICKELEREVDSGKIDYQVVNGLLQLPVKTILKIIEYDEHMQHPKIDENKELEGVTLKKLCQIVVYKKRHSPQDQAILHNFRMFYNYQVHQI